MRLLTYLLRVQPGEGRKLWLFFLLAVLMQAGSTMGISAADAIFLDRLGAERLPLVYIVLPLLMLVITPILGYIGRRRGVQQVLLLSMLGIAGGSLLSALFASWAAEADEQVALYLILAVKLFASMAFVSLYTWYWNYIDEFFDLQDAKRIYPILTAGMALGSICGGVGMALLLGLLAVWQLFLLWAVLALAVLPLLLFINREQRALDMSDEVDTSFVQGLQQMGRALLRSPYVQAITGLLFLGMFVATVCEFHYLSIFSAEIQEPGDGTLSRWIGLLVGDVDAQGRLAILLGVLMAAVNVMNLLLSLFLVNRLTLRWGVRNVALIQPLAYLLVFAFLLMDYSLAAALAGFVVYQGLQYSVDYSNWNLVFNAVPEESKSEVRGVLEGLVEPVGTSLAGVFLLFTVGMAGEQQLLLILLLVLLYLACAFFLRSQYLGAHLRNLRRQWLDFARLVAGGGSQRLTEDDVQALLQRSQDANPSTSLTALRLLSVGDAERTVDPLLDWLQRSPIPGQAAATGLVVQLLDSGLPWVVRRFVYGIYDRAVALHGDLVQELAARGMINPSTASELVESQRAEERQAGLTALWHSWHPGQVHRALGAIAELLAEDAGPVQRRQALRLLGHCGESRFGIYLADRLSDSDQALRRQAMQALAQVADSTLRSVTPAVLAVLGEADEELREHGLTVLLRIQDPAALSELLALAPGFTGRHRRRVQEIAKAIGLRAVPALVAVLRDVSLPLAGRALAARILADISFPQLQALLDEVVDTALADAAAAAQRAHLLAHSQQPGLQLLRRALIEREQAAARMVLDLLGFGGRLPNVDLLRASLTSPNPKVRANALEAIEQAVSAEVYHAICIHLGLLAGRGEFQAGGASQRDVPGLLRQLLTSDDEVLAVLAYDYRRSHGETRQRGDTLLRMRCLGRPLLDRVLGEGKGEHEAPGLVEVAQCLLHHHLFSILSVDQALQLATRGRWQHQLEDGECCAFQSVILVVRGQLRDGNGSLHGPGAMQGVEIIFGGPPAHELHLCAGSWILLIDRQAIDQLLDLESGVALTLWQRWGAS